MLPTRLPSANSPPRCHTYPPNVPRPRSAILALLLAVHTAPNALAQSLEQLKAQLEQARHDDARPSARPDPAQRRSRLAQADELRARLLASSPDDELAATWLADRAAYALDQAGAGGLDVVVLLGVPTREQIEQAQAIAERALDLLARADAASAQAVARLESRLLDRMTPLDPAATAEIEQRLRHLVDLEQARRIPYLRALAQTLLAGCTGDPARRIALATAAVRTLKDLPAPTPALGASRLCALGLALVQAAETEHQTELLRAAADQFTLALEQTSGLDPGLRARAALGLVRAGRAETLPVASPDPAVQRELEPLGMEARAALAFSRARRSVVDRVELLSSGVKLLIASAPTPEQVSLGAPDRRPAVYQKIAENLGRDVPLRLLPAEAGFAKAISVARSAGPSDERPRAEALALLRTVSERTDAPGALRAQALWESAVIVASSGDESRELQALGEVFTREPESEYALPAARRVFESFSRRQEPSVALPEPLRRLVGLRDAALATLIARDRADDWRLAGVRLAIIDLAAPGLVEPALARARELTLAMLTEAARSDARGAVNDALYRLVLKSRDAVPPAELLSLARVAQQHAKAADPQRQPEYALVLGQAQLAAGRPEALQTLEALSGGPIDHPESPLWPRFRFALADAKTRAGDQPGAFVTLREVAESLEAEAGSASRPTEYWQAWVRMLEIQQNLNTAGERSADILVQIARLELIDPQLGGTAFAPRIRTLAHQAQAARPALKPDAVPTAPAAP